MNEHTFIFKNGEYHKEVCEYCRELETTNWHYYKCENGVMMHVRKDAISAIIGGSYEEIVVNRPKKGDKVWLDFQPPVELTHEYIEGSRRAGLLHTTGAEMSKEYGLKNHIAEGKHDMSLLPIDLLADMLCPAYSEGLKKYYRESWRNGFPTSVMMAATLRHLSKFYYEGEDYDKETEEAYGIKKHHLGSVIFCCIAMYNSVINHPELDDRRKEVQNDREVQGTDL